MRSITLAIATSILCAITLISVEAKTGHSTCEQRCREYYCSGGPHREFYCDFQCHRKCLSNERAPHLDATLNKDHGR